MTADICDRTGPYGENATVKAANTFSSADAGTWLIVTTVAPSGLPHHRLDPQHAIQEGDGPPALNPRGCDIAPPLVEAARR